MKTVLFIPIIIGLPVANRRLKSYFVNRRSPVAMGMLCSSPLQTGAT